MRILKSPSHPRGLTLTELIAGLAILSILTAVAVPAANRWLAEYRVVATTNQILALMRLARVEAMTGGPVLLCAAEDDCSAFPATRVLALRRANPAPPHEHPADDLPPLEVMTTPANTLIEWRRFRGNALVFQRSGILHFQNGHFLVCNGTVGRRIVMNWSGRPRVEALSDAGDC